VACIIEYGHSEGDPLRWGFRGVGDRGDVGGGRRGQEEEGMRREEGGGVAIRAHAQQDGIHLGDLRRVVVVVVVVVRGGGKMASARRTNKTYPPPTHIHALFRSFLYLSRR